MTILITGSVGKTAAPLAASLSASGIPILVTSRAPPENPTYPTARFDWMDASTYSIPFTHEVASKSPITAAYLVGPMVLDCLEQLKAFVDYARKEQGVKRFVLLKYSAKEGGEPALREMGEWLEELGQKGEIQWCVLCPSWFMGKSFYLLFDMIRRK